MPKNDTDAGNDTDCADAENATDAKNGADDDDREVCTEVLDLQEAVNCSCHRPPLIKLQLH